MILQLLLGGGLFLCFTFILIAACICKYWFTSGFYLYVFLLFFIHTSFICYLIFTWHHFGMRQNIRKRTKGDLIAINIYKNYPVYFCPCLGKASKMIKKTWNFLIPLYIQKCKFPWSPFHLIFIFLTTILDQPLQGFHPNSIFALILPIMFLKTYNFICREGWTVVTGEVAIVVGLGVKAFGLGVSSATYWFPCY